MAQRAKTLKIKKVQAKKIEPKTKRKTSSQRGYNGKWQRLRESFANHHPALCTHCMKKDILKAANHLDHIIPHKGQDDPLFWDWNNLQWLCHSCHSVKTATEDGGFGNQQKMKF